LRVKRGYVSEIFSSFQGEGLFAGRKHLFVRMAGCNLRCRYCDTPDSLVRVAAGKIHRDGFSDRSFANPVAPAELAELVRPFLTTAGLHALSITGGEPLMQTDFLHDWLAYERPGVPVMLETNGTYAERLATLLPLVDMISMDVKLPSNSGEASFWSEHGEFLAMACEKMVYVKIPVDEDTLENEVTTAAELIAGVSPRIAVFLQPIVDDDGRPRVSSSRLTAFYDAAVARLADVRVLPQTHKVLGLR
jgi:organic radical activating enzyme